MENIQKYKIAAEAGYMVTNGEMAPIAAASWALKNDATREERDTFEECYLLGQAIAGLSTCFVLVYSVVKIGKGVLKVRKLFKRKR